MRESLTQHLLHADGVQVKLQTARAAGDHQEQQHGTALFFQIPIPTVNQNAFGSSFIFKRKSYQHIEVNVPTAQ